MGRGVWGRADIDGGEIGGRSVLVLAAEVEFAVLCAWLVGVFDAECWCEFECIAAIERTVTCRSTLFVGGEERRFLQAGPEGFAFGG